MYPTQTTSQLVQLADELYETQVSPGILGFIVFALLGAAVWLLLKSMNRHMKRVDFDQESQQDAGDGKSGRAMPGQRPAGEAAVAAGGDGAQRPHPDASE